MLLPLNFVRISEASYTLNKLIQHIRTEFIVKLRNSCFEETYELGELVWFPHNHGKYGYNTERAGLSLFIADLQFPSALFLIGFREF